VGASPLQEIARVLSSRGIAATVVGDVVVALLPRLQDTSEGSRHVTFRHCRIRSLSELGLLLGDDSGQLFWKDALAEMELAAAVAHAPVVERKAWWKVDRLLPAFGARSVTCGILTFVLLTSAWEDLMSAQPRAPVGTFFVSLFFLWQAYRRPAALPQGAPASTGQARLYALASVLAFLVMLMLLGHSADAFLFGVHIQPVNTMAAFVICTVVLVFLRNGEVQSDPSASLPGSGFFGTALRSGEAAFAVSGFIWLLVLVLMPPHRPVFEHGLGAPPAAVMAPAGQGRGQ
jgi:hypothetical protein